MQLFDGHNGSAAALYSKEALLNNILAAIPTDLNRDEWIAALPRSLVAGFVKTDKDFQERGIYHTTDLDKNKRYASLYLKLVQVLMFFLVIQFCQNIYMGFVRRVEKLGCYFNPCMPL